MWHKRLLEYDPLRRRAEWHYYDPHTGDVAIESQWDVEPVLEANKGVFNPIDERAPWKGDWHHVASIPMAVVEDYMVRHKINLLAQENRSTLRRFLNDKDNRVFRTRPGRI